MYLSILHRHKHCLQELCRIERVQETSYNLAVLNAQGAESDDEAARIMQRADAEREMASEVNRALRSQLPTALRRLTAGYEMRTYWFEVFECFRKGSLWMALWPSDSPWILLG